EAGMMPGRPRALLGAADEDPRAARLPFLRRLMEFALHHDEAAYFTRNRELAFLANTLLAGCSVQSRPFTPQEASDAAASICNLGLECWPARDATDVLAMLDMTAWVSVLGLLDECPILPAALTAVLERRTTSVSPTAFEFISTTAQIGDIRLFMRTLPGVLSP